MDFSSDTAAPAHPDVLTALARANVDSAPSYGADAASARIAARFRDAFEIDVEVLLVASGTAANALALSIVCSPTGAILCHQEAHIERDERGAPEFFTGGAKLQLLPGDRRGILDAAALDTALRQRDPGFVHETPAEVLSLTNLNERGAAYQPDEIAERAERARADGLFVHLDGARLANAAASSGCALRRLTWEAGVDVVTFGFTKTGALGCEAIVLFGRARERIDALRARAKRSGHLPPKMRFLAAQAEAMLTDALWRRLAEHANAQAQALALGFAQVPGAAFPFQDESPALRPIDGNEVFVRLPSAAIERLKAAGAKTYPWPGDCWRFVCSWATPTAEIERAIGIVTQP